MRRCEINTVKRIGRYNIHCVSKNVPPLQLAIIFTCTVRLRQFLAQMLRKKYAIKVYFIFPPHLTSASALPGETRNSEIASFHLNAACCFTKNIRVLELWQMIPQILPFSMGLAGRHYNSVRTTMLQYDDAMHQQNDGLYQFSRRNW